MNLSQLSAPFNAEDLKVRPITISKKTGKAMFAPYVSNRAIMDRLDDVCGPANWRNEFAAGPAGGIVCGLSIRTAHYDGSHEWVTKWDGAENSDVEPVKGGLSNAMRRAAVQWGIGRYLYRIDMKWAKCDDYGKPMNLTALLDYYVRAGQPHGLSVIEEKIQKSTPAPSENNDTSLGKLLDGLVFVGLDITKEAGVAESMQRQLLDACRQDVAEACHALGELGTKGDAPPAEFADWHDALTQFIPWLRGEVTAYGRVVTRNNILTYWREFARLVESQ